jgi:hypothetical protein
MPYMGAKYAAHVAAWQPGTAQLEELPARFAVETETRLALAAPWLAIRLSRESSVLLAAKGRT